MDTEQDAERLKARYQHGLEAIAQVLNRDWDQMLTFYQPPRAYWVHLTINQAANISIWENSLFNVHGRSRRDISYLTSHSYKDRHAHDMSDQG